MPSTDTCLLARIALAAGQHHGRCAVLTVFLLVLANVSMARADVFGTGSDQFTIDFTAIGNPGNAADTTGYGAVGYVYRIGTHTVSQNQLQAATTASGQDFGGGRWSGDQPAANVSWYQAAAFVNWLNTSTGHHAAYDLSYSGGVYSISPWQSGQAGYDAGNPLRNSLAWYALATEDEWYKSAYGKGNGIGYFQYPTASDTAPTAVASGTAAGTAVYNGLSPDPVSVFQAGGASPYGTFGQGGNAYQMLESVYGGGNDYHVMRGGAWYNPNDNLKSSYRVDCGDPSFGSLDVGFRVVSPVPEPSAFVLVGCGGMALLIARRRHAAA